MTTPKTKGQLAYEEMSKEQAAAIAAHLKAHEGKLANRTAARLARYERAKRRGLEAAIRALVHK